MFKKSWGGGRTLHDRILLEGGKGIALTFGREEVGCKEVILLG